jgi:hypothetical protein
VICLQLLVGCNSYTSSVQTSFHLPSDEDFFEISGSIASTFSRLSNALISTAAAETETGVITIATIDEADGLVVQDKVTLYDDNKSFKFKLKKSLVKGGFIYFEYKNSDETSRFTNLALTEQSQLAVEVEVTAQSTFETDMFFQKAIEMVKADEGKVDVAKIVELAKSFKPDEYKERLDLIGGYIGYVDSFLTMDDARPILEAFSKGAPAEEIQQELIKNSRSIRMICDPDSGIIFSGTSLNSKASMSFEASSEEDRIALGSETSLIDLADTASTSDAKETLKSFKEKLRFLATLNNKVIKGALHFLNHRNGLEAKCPLEAKPEPYPVADKTSFDNFDNGHFGSYTYAFNKLLDIANLTKMDLRSVYIIQGLIDSPELIKQTEIIDGWYQDSLAAIQKQFNSDKLQANLTSMDAIQFSAFASKDEAQIALDKAKQQVIMELDEQYKGMAPNQENYDKQLQIIENRAQVLKVEKDSYFANLPPLALNPQYLDEVIFGQFTNRRAASEALHSAINQATHDLDILFNLRGANELDAYEAQRQILSNMIDAKLTDLKAYFDNLDTVKADEKYFLALNFNLFPTFQEAELALAKIKNDTVTDLKILNELDENSNMAKYGDQYRLIESWYAHYKNLLITVFTDRCNLLTADLSDFESIHFESLNSEVEAITAIEQATASAQNKLSFKFGACGKFSSTQFEIESTVIKNMYYQQADLAKQYFNSH